MKNEKELKGWTCAILEKALCYYKTDFLHNEKIERLTLWDKFKPKNTKEKYQKEKAIKQLEISYKNDIHLVEKQNSRFVNQLKGINDVVDETTDLYLNFTKLFFDALDLKKDTESIHISAALLIKDENGKYELDGIKYNLITR